MTTPPLTEQTEAHRDRISRRDEDLRIESAIDAQRFIEDANIESGVRLANIESGVRLAICAILLLLYN